MHPLCEWSFDYVGWGLGGGIKLREWSAEGAGCECFDRFITEVGGDDFPTSPV
jgi:hypothetical protein